MDIRSQDTFGFLYAVANALAMRGVDIHKVRISSESGEARDRFSARADTRAKHVPSQRISVCANPGRD